MLAEHRRLIRLIVDAGIGASNAAMVRRSNASIQSCCFNRAATAKSVPRGSVIVGMHAALNLGQRRQPLQPFDAGDAQRFGIRHDVRLRTGTKSVAQIASNTKLVLNRPLARRPGLAAQHHLFVFSQAHCR